VAVGEAAPDFTLETDEEKRVSLKDYRGRKVVLYFYPKDGTPGCTTEALEFKDIAKEFAK
jgi:peroxiredoxin Q/BCP